jgi:hypothetical protein
MSPLRSIYKLYIISISADAQVLVLLHLRRFTAEFESDRVNRCLSSPCPRSVLHSGVTCI